MQHYAYVILFLFILALILTIYNAYCAIELIVYKNQCKKNSDAKKKMRLNLFKYIFGINRLVKKGNTKFKRFAKRVGRAIKWALICGIITLIATIILFGMVWVFHNMMHQYTIINKVAIGISHKNNAENKDDAKHGLDGEETTDENGETVTNENSESSGDSSNVSTNENYGEDTGDDTQYSVDHTALVPKGLRDYKPYTEAIYDLQIEAAGESGNDIDEIYILQKLDDIESVGTLKPYYEEVYKQMKAYWDTIKSTKSDDDKLEAVFDDIRNSTYEDFIAGDKALYSHPSVVIALNVAAYKNDINYAGVIFENASSYGLDVALNTARSEINS